MHRDASITCTAYLPPGAPPPPPSKQRQARATQPATRPRVPSLMPAPARMQPPSRRARVVVAADLTKVAASVAVGGALLYRHDAVSVLYVAGAAANSVAGKCLKQVIRQPRPTDVRSDPGMPSSHATSLAFLSLAALARVAAHPHTVIVPHVAELALAAGGVAAAALASSWRVRAGYHTTEQVIAGWVLGAVDAAIWGKVFVPWAKPALEVLMRNDMTAYAIVASILTIAVLFVFGSDINNLLTTDRQL